VLILLTYELKSNADKEEEEEVKKYNCRKGAAKADD